MGSCTSILVHALGSTARTRRPRADAQTPAGSNWRTITTNELLSELEGRGPWSRRKGREDLGQHRSQGGSPAAVLWKLRRPRLLNDGRRGPCGRLDQVRP